MKIIIPMAGTGDRFVKAGYTNPKPLITVGGKKIIEYICDMFDKEEDEFIFICNEKHLAETNMRWTLKNLVDNYKILSIPNHKRGPVHTVLESGVLRHIEDNEEVIVCYCDNPYVWNYEHFKKTVRETKAEGCILSHVDFHPHRLSGTLMAYMKQENLVVSEIKEKSYYTESPEQEHASTGTYYFKKGSYLKKYFNELVEKNINYNGEFYVTLVYNLLIQDSLKVTCYPTEYALVFGVPSEVENFEAWQTILSESQVKNEEDLIRSYRYWKKYNESRNTL